MKKVTVEELIKMLVKCKRDKDEVTCVTKSVSEKISAGVPFEGDEDLGAEIDELDIDGYKYKIVGVSQFEGVSGRGVQIIFDGEG